MLRPRSRSPLADGAGLGAAAALALLLVPAGLGCDTSSIQDGQELGPVVTVGDFFTSSFLLPTEAGAVLFDAGYSADAEPILAALEARGLGPEDVTDVFLSHGHGDHVGGLGVFDGAFLRGFAQEQRVLDEEAPGGVRITAPLQDGGVVQVGGRSIEVFHVPGHTPGSAVYLVGGVLLMGDSAVATAGGELAQPPDRFSEDVEELDRSLFALADRLRGRDAEVDWIACAHSGPLEGLGPLLDYAGRD